MFVAVDFGSWFEHIKGWTAQEGALNLLHITFEQMSMVKNKIKILVVFLWEDFLRVIINAEGMKRAFRSCSNPNLSNTQQAMLTKMNTSKLKYLK